MFVRATRADVNGEKATRLTTELKAETSRTEASTSASRAEVSSNSLTRKRAYPEACSKSTIDTDMMNLDSRRGPTITEDTDTGELTKWSKSLNLFLTSQLRHPASPQHVERVNQNNKHLERTDARMRKICSEFLEGKPHPAK